LGLLTVFVWPLSAQAGVEGSGDEPLIYGGLPAQVCQWPTTVLMDSGNGLCSGTLVHPELVTYAAHCPQPAVVTFGEAQGGARTVPVEHCMKNIDVIMVGPEDYAYCKLSQPVLDVPITPPVYGCEVDKLVAGAEVTIAGFGATEMGGAGTKYIATTVISAEDNGNNMILVGQNGTSAWMGDSGGPAYIQYEEDQTWHPFGIVSGGTAPGVEVQYVKMWTAIPWIEENSGVDITPCHDVNGEWAPTQDCGGFATNPASTGTWDNGCQDDDPLSGLAATCGPPAVEDFDPPLVVITAPPNGSVYPLPEGEEFANVDFTVDASDELTGIRKVWIKIQMDEMDPVELADDADNQEPYVFDGAVFPEGSYVITAIAEDLAGNLAESEPIGLAVGDVEPPDVDTGDDGGTGEDDAAGDEDGGKGCGCTSTDAHPAASLLLLGLLAVRRRRRSA
jgi:MYXO-CTERM domain-containing protein